VDIYEFMRTTAKHQAALTMDLHLSNARGAIDEVSQGWYEQWPTSVRVAALRELTKLRDSIDTLMGQLNEPVEDSLQGRCEAPMHHAPPATGTWPCVLPALHQRFEVDHMDEHGHTAPLLVHWSTIMEVRAVQAARERGEFD
jgi:hypothetical protein